MDYDKIRHNRKEYLYGAHYEKLMTIPVTLHISALNMDYTIKHDTDFMSRFEDYIYATSTLSGDTNIVGPGGTFPITFAQKVLNDLKRINGNIFLELFTKQNAVDAIDRANYSTDEEFETAVNVIDWEFDITQTFTFD